MVDSAALHYVPRALPGSVLALKGVAVLLVPVSLGALHCTAQLENAVRFGPLALRATFWRLSRQNMMPHASVDAKYQFLVQKYQFLVQKYRFLVQNVA